MKLRLLPLSILLVTSLAACQKTGPAATVTPNPNAPAPKDSTVKVNQNRWDWGGNEPLSYKFNGVQINSNQDKSFYKNVTDLSGESYISIYSTGEDNAPHNTMLNLWLPNKIKEMFAGQEYTLPTTYGGMQVSRTTVDNVDPGINFAFLMNTSDGGNLRVRITNISATEIEGRFYGVVKQRKDVKTNSGIDWGKIEEGYFKFKLDDTTAM